MYVRIDLDRVRHLKVLLTVVSRLTGQFANDPTGVPERVSESRFECDATGVRKPFRICTQYQMDSLKLVGPPCAEHQNKVPFGAVSLMRTSLQSTRSRDPHAAS
jgi:hypothetical protein